MEGLRFGLEVSNYCLEPIKSLVGGLAPRSSHNARVYPGTSGFFFLDKKNRCKWTLSKNEPYEMKNVWATKSLYGPLPCVKFSQKSLKSACARSTLNVCTPRRHGNAMSVSVIPQRLPGTTTCVVCTCGRWQFAFVTCDRLL